jgi:hypothetical protein
MFNSKKGILATAVALAMASEAADGKKLKFCDKDFDLDEKKVIFAFGNGTTLELEVGSLTPELQTRLMLHGALQKIGDSYAGAKGDFAQGIRDAQAVIDGLKSGEWRSAAGEGEGRPRLGELAEAVSRIKQVPLDKAMAAVEKMDDKARKDIRSNAKVKAVIAQIRAEKAQKELESAANTELSIDLA